ncbi:Phenylacetic acid catabolic protein [Pseudodonghicola xiamenensis]|uniref:Ring-oxidation complex protein 1 in the phenylacetic acid catabolism pathway n=1 Tax=Pseudodonghicola xiamenensis TaxID=337702 RepID=A0A8J3MDN4_9RHOB|nr:Phenylacetic acid catabolic protein [Pseudodonghicola xiamenensis]GHG92561.1 ring-oxidation complex protein 1 in the phenylacetic acid catabolism pathway [Pseudodonghicola xiamenensis]
MTEEMRIEEYLAQGGVLSNPANVPPRYRAELMKLMASFVDSELAGAAGFADIINQGPGIKERIAAARIVLEKTDHAGQVLRIMGDFGADTDRYATHHPWTARLTREADIGATRGEHDMRLAVFNYPLMGWTDAVTMNLLMSRAVAVQMADFAQLSYQPLAEAFRAIAPVEAHHAELAEEGIAKLIANGETAEIEASLAYWWPRVAASFGATASAKADSLRAMGLRHVPNAELKARWEAETHAVLVRLGLNAPA